MFYSDPSNVVIKPFWQGAVLEAGYFTDVTWKVKAIITEWAVFSSAFGKKASQTRQVTTHVQVAPQWHHIRF